MLNKLLNFFWNRNRTRPPEKDMSPGQAETMFAAGDVPPGGSVNPNYDNYENGLPPDWDVRRREVLIRDNFICQAVGCLRSGSNLHAHHRRARFEGGSHRLENLVALCAVHHAIVHLDVSKVEVSLPTYAASFPGIGGEYPIRLNELKSESISDDIN